MVYPTWSRRVGGLVKQEQWFRGLCQCKIEGGGMAERLKAAVLKTVSGVTHSGVRIPLPPPEIQRLMGTGHALARRPDVLPLCMKCA